MFLCCLSGNFGADPLSFFAIYVTPPHHTNHYFSLDRPTKCPFFFSSGFSRL